MKMMPRSKTVSVVESPAAGGRPSGLTMLELVVVLVILTATAVIVIPMIRFGVETPSQGEMTPDQIVTRQTLSVVREAIVGADGVIENLAHAPNALPRKMEELVHEEPPTQVTEHAPQLVRYDPVFRIGWRGPYLLPTGLAADGRPTVVDAWGNELDLQIDFDDDGQITHEESNYARVVSAGPNGRLETPKGMTKMKPGANSARELTLDECGDDLVMFLKVPDFRQ